MNAERRVSTLEAATRVRSNSDFDPMIRTSSPANLNSLRQGPQMVAAVTAIVEPYPFTRFFSDPWRAVGGL